jgi:[lysine-biosynthesis-protein LysW]--L-2-aminoadipate ligase
VSARLFPLGRDADALRAFFIVAGESTDTNNALLAAAGSRFARAALIRAEQLQPLVTGRDLVLGRLDVCRSLDGIERGLIELQELEETREDVAVVNPAGALFACHDKVATAVALHAAGVPHPQTACVDHPSQLAGIGHPVVVKPRFGSWGIDVFRCDTLFELKRCFREISKRSWFQRQGALVQELVSPTGSDLRVLVAGGAIVGAVVRKAQSGEWRTNVSLGASRHPVQTLAPEAARLALKAASAVGADLVGVDLLPLPGGGWVVLELNGAVDFTPDYSLTGSDVNTEVISRLVVWARHTARPPYARQRPVDSNSTSGEESLS